MPVAVNVSYMQAGTAYQLQMTGGGNVLSVISYDTTIFSAVQASGNTVTITAASNSPTTPLSGSLQIGVAEAGKQVSFSTSAPLGVHVNVVGAVALNNVFTVATTPPPPGCVNVGAGANGNTPVPSPYNGEGYSFYLAEHQWVLCKECPGSCSGRQVQGRATHPLAALWRKTTAGWPAQRTAVLSLDLRSRG